MSVRAKIVAALAGIAIWSPAMAAPFCVQVTGVPPQCLYVDPTQCQQQANHAGGQCGVNPAEIKAPVSVFPYCLVSSGNVMTCVYPDRATCNTDATRQGGACLASTELPKPATTPIPGEDPYRLVRP
jgi:hypothetical protein